MTDDVTTTAPPPLRRTRLDAVIAVALLVVALWPIYADRARLPGSDAASPQVRLQVAWETHTRRAIAAGEVPLWNPYHYAGRLHLADPRTLALYPPHVVLRFLPIALFFIVSFVLHGWLFGLGAYAVARRLGVPPLGSCAAAIGVMLLGIVAPGATLGYAPSLYTIAWLPLLVALALRASAQSSLRPPFFLVIVAALALTTGGRAVIYGAGAIATCYVFALAWPADRAATARRTLLRLAVVLVSAAGLAAFQLVPSVRLSSAAAWTGGLRASGPAATGPDDDRGGGAGLSAASVSVSPASLSLPDGQRVVSTCGSALDATRMLQLGIPGVDGGGAYAADYGQFVSLAAGTPDGRADVLAMTQPSTRRDLLSLLSAGVYVSCGANGTSAVASGTAHVQISRAPQPLPRAFWTCSPRRVGRQELDYRLQNYRYDDTLSLYPANPVLNVRWAAGLDTAVREQAEAALHIRPRRLIEDRTWQYDLLDASRTNLAAIVRDPLVEDTAGFDRGSLELPPAPAAPEFDERQSEWLLGVDRCDALQPATIERMDTADGRFVATVTAPRDGVVIVSDAYHPDRFASVDGAQVEAMRANLALTAIPVRAGMHRIELRTDASALWVGVGLTLLTLVAWVAVARVQPR